MRWRTAQRQVWGARTKRLEGQPKLAPVLVRPTSRCRLTRTRDYDEHRYTPLSRETCMSSADCGENLRCLKATCRSARATATTTRSTSSSSAPCKSIVGSCTFGEFVCGEDGPEANFGIAVQLRRTQWSLVGGTLLKFRRVVRMRILRLGVLQPNMVLRHQRVRRMHVDRNQTQA